MNFVTPQIIQQGQNYRVQHGDDSGLFVQFYMESVQDHEESAKAGRPIFVDKEFIKIIPVGDRNTVICEPVRHQWSGNEPPHTERFARQYAAFKNQQHEVVEGTPLEQWPPLTKSQVMNFKTASVYTVEQLAAVSDANLHNLGMGARDLRDKAIAYLKNAKETASLMESQQEINALKDQIEALKNQLAGFKSVIAEEDAPKRRGRPPAQKEDVDG